MKHERAIKAVTSTGGKYSVEEMLTVQDLAMLGAAILDRVERYLVMVKAGTPRSGAEHWLAEEAFDASRDLLEIK